MADEIVFDPETGLPVLPEGQRWRVQRDRGGLRVEIEHRQTRHLPRYKKTFFGRRFDDIEEDTYWEAQEYWAYTNEGSARAVREAAIAVLRRYEEEAAITALLGTYPPNRLEVDRG